MSSAKLLKADATGVRSMAGGWAPVASWHGWLYATDAEGLWVHHYGANEATIELVWMRRRTPRRRAARMTFVVPPTLIDSMSLANDRRA